MHERRKKSSASVVCNTCIPGFSLRYVVIYKQGAHNNSDCSTLFEATTLKPMDRVCSDVYVGKNPVGVEGGEPGES